MDLTSVQLPRTDAERDAWISTLKSDLYREDPDFWVNDKLQEFTWSKQKDILRSVAANRRTAVYSCHRVGKSWLAARLAVWWIDSHAPGDALVITSSHSAVQVKAAIWREIGRVHAKHKLAGRMNQAEWHMTMPAGNEELVAFGRKPADDDTTAFQGVYARYVLVLIDEACYIAKPLWEGIDTLISNEDSRVVAFANPDDVNTEFGEVCKPGSGWNVISIGYMDTPNFSGEQVPEAVSQMLIGPTWVEEKRKKWGETNPLFISKVLGKFPHVSTDGLISLQLIRAAQERTLAASEPNELGVDVGGGSNKNIIAHRRGPIVRIILQDQNPDTMQTLSNTLDALKTTGASRAKIDGIGIGHGAADRAKEMSTDQDVKKQTPDLARRAGLIVNTNVGMPANDKESYVNLRAEGYWTLRQRFEEGNIDIDEDDEDLAAQLIAIKYKRSGGRIQIESKEDMRKRGVPSPDKADAVMLAFADPPAVEVKKVVRSGWRIRRGR